MTDRRYTHNGHTLIIRNDVNDPCEDFDRILTLTEESIRDNSMYGESMVLCIADKATETQFAVSKVPSLVPRLISVTVLWPKTVGSRKVASDVGGTFHCSITEALTYGFEFSMIPSPTDAEVDLVNSKI